MQIYQSRALFFCFNFRWSPKRCAAWGRLSARVVGHVTQHVNVVVHHAEILSSSAAPTPSRDQPPDTSCDASLNESEDLQRHFEHTRQWIIWCKHRELDRPTKRFQIVTQTQPTMKHLRKG